MGCVQSKEENEKLIAENCTGNTEQLKEQEENQARQVTLLMLGMLELILILMLKTFVGSLFLFVFSFAGNLIQTHSLISLLPHAVRLGYLFLQFTRQQKYTSPSIYDVNVSIFQIYLLIFTCNVFVSHCSKDAKQENTECFEFPNELLRKPESFQ